MGQLWTKCRILEPISNASFNFVDCRFDNSCHSFSRDIVGRSIVGYTLNADNKLQKWQYTLQVVQCMQIAWIMHTIIKCLCCVLYTIIDAFVLLSALLSQMVLRHNLCIFFASNFRRWRWVPMQIGTLSDYVLGTIKFFWLNWLSFKHRKNRGNGPKLPIHLLLVKSPRDVSNFGCREVTWPIPNRNTLLVWPASQ